MKNRLGKTPLHWAFCLFLATLPAPMRAQTLADVVLVHGKVWTENPQQAEAVAILGNRIAGVGSSAEMLQLAGPGTKVIELGGKRVLPGFNDAHVHFIDGGSGLASVQLRDASSQAEFGRRIAGFAKTQPKGAWILQGNWDHEKWVPAQLPNHQLIDDVTADNPVFVYRLDGHMALANALAMKLAGVTRDTTDIPGGVIVRDTDGNPTGVFKDAAVALIERVIPPMTAQQMTAAIVAGEKYAAENGVTSIQDLPGSTTDMHSAATFRAYETMWREGRLTVRISRGQRLLDWKRLADVGVITGLGNDTLRVGGLKSFADGALGSTTAWFFQPYSDSPNTSGIASDELVHSEAMYADMKGGDLAGLQLITHAIGDRANNTILNMYERLEKEDGPRDRRWRIEHAQHLLRSDIPRFASLHVVASMQPYHCIDDGRWAEKRIGSERIKTTYAFRSLLDSGATLAFGSDWPVAPMVPLMGIYAATTRRTLDGKNPEGWVPEQKITVAEAVHAYTFGSAYAEGEETVKGWLAPGKLADLVVLSKDIFHIDPIEIENTSVELTVFNGKIIYQRQPAPRLE